jgi:prophage regulatory protein
MSTMATTITATPSVLRLREVLRRTGLSRSSLYRLIAKGQFSDPISLCGRCVGWYESEVTQWILSRARQPSPSVNLLVAKVESLGGGK